MAAPSLFRNPLTRLNRYILRQILGALVAVTLALVALIWLTQSLRFVELIVNRGLSPFVFLRLTVLLVPSFVAVILPITMFVVVQFIYQRLSGDRELTVMRAAGLSPFALAKPTLILATGVAVLCLWLNIWIVPASFTAFREYQFEIRNRIAAFLIQEGVFTTISNNLTVYVRKRDPSGDLHGIMVDDERNPANPATIIAQSGRIEPGRTGPQVILFNGARQEVDKKSGRLNLLTFSENTINLSSTASDDDERFRDDSEVSLHDLLHPAPGELLPQDVPKWRAEAYRRLSEPFTVVSYALVALASVLTGAFRRHGGFARPAIGVAITVGLVALGLSVGNLAARNSALLPLVWIHAILPGVVAAWLLFRPERIHVPRVDETATPTAGKAEV
ncbi:LPS export ABC transporter permease LptF [Acidisoma cellulosilytica]|uniref:LPS export ABC transporter permease LptF n=1 Tax=Acidisoma cellulosilyticum TaxID=2802395 RepID=A0A963YXB1_9PROT|nr:LPS export ABC transporter permease LptF [Acidisoma cellulosilyticum]MCB8878932.1 LPS export ABC transporter permease LptF [Acidisoma cellulosilyticum]